MSFSSGGGRQNFATTAADAELGPVALENADGSRTPTGTFLEVGSLATDSPAARDGTREPAIVVIEPTDLGATMEWLFQGLCLSMLNLSPTQSTCLFANGNKASLSVCNSGQHRGP